MANSEQTLKTSELQERNAGELKSLRQSKVEELHKARFKHALGQLEQTHVLRTLRRDIARIETVLGTKVKVA